MSTCSHSSLVSRHTRTAHRIEHWAYCELRLSTLGHEVSSHRRPGHGWPGHGGRSHRLVSHWGADTAAVDRGQILELRDDLASNWWWPNSRSDDGRLSYWHSLAGGTCASRDGRVVVPAGRLWRVAVVIDGRSVLTQRLCVLVVWRRRLHILEDVQARLGNLAHANQ